MSMAFHAGILDMFIVYKLTSTFIYTFSKKRKLRTNSFLMVGPV